MNIANKNNFQWNIYLSAQCERLGIYFHPFVYGSANSDAILNCDITFEIFCSVDDNWLAIVYEGKRYRYTEQEMQWHWKMIEYQRKVLAAASLVYSGEFIAINPAMRSLGLSI
jgi:hypothetical protein